MAQGEEPRKRLESGIHSHHGECRSHHREAEHCPQRAHTHRHAHRRQQREHEYAKALSRQHRQDSKQEDDVPSALVRKSHHAIYINKVANHHQQTQYGLRQHLADKGNEDVAVGLFEPLVRTLKFQFGAYRVGCEDEDEEEHHSRDEHRREIGIVVGVGIAYAMQFDLDGLEQRHNLTLCHTHSLEFGFCHTCISEGGDGLEVAHEQRTSREERHGVIEGNPRLATCQHIGGTIARKIYEGIYLASLQCLACGSHIGITRLDMSVLEGIERAHHLARHRRIVEIDNTHRHFGRLSLPHQCGEKYHHQQGKHHQTGYIKPIVAHKSHFALNNFPHA